MHPFCGQPFGLQGSVARSYPRVVPAQKKRVLVVDDEPQVRATIAEALALEGYDVTEAGNGAEGLALLRTTRPDVIVLDLWMPIMDGWEFRKAQVQAHPGIPIVVLSALDLSHERLVELRADALVGKPFDLEQLYGAVAKAVAGGS
jgi:CheY-like chemotaxis protein